MSNQQNILSTFLKFAPINIGNTTRITDTFISRLILERTSCGLNSGHEQLFYTQVNDDMVTVVKLHYFAALRDAGFVIQPIGYDYAAILVDEVAGCVKSLFIFNASVDTAGFNFFGDEENICFWMEHCKKCYEVQGSTIATLSVEEGRPTLKTTSKFMAKKTGRLGKDSFYPFMKLSIEDYFDRYMESSSRILVLVGAPGTGKSTFLRTLMLSKTNRSLVAYSSDVFTHTDFIRHFNTSRWELLGMEDIDLYISARDAGNKHMSAFLNATEGVTSNEGSKKIIFSTNLPSIDKIDPALLRRGRCFDVIEFRLLTVEEARVVEIDMGLPEQDLSSKAKWSLAEILNPPQDFLQLNNRARKHVGFTG